ncbi:glycoside hydrolase family 19 protein [Pseudomonas vranovensis]|uniref:glycoside hydrolase family 19 protein n=1 Tax=Pseudomonas vranovensis TaxID=321661 RepID=UPI0003FED9A0|nr:glycoside hydrolase family 19 protein [Pseudomonas vranovensis]
MPITEQQLLQILPNARPVAGIFLPSINRAMARFKIDSRVRQAAFLAQIGHESGHLRNLVENLNYSAEALMRTWTTRFNAALAKEYARQPERIANVVYNARMGNIHPGDGWRFRGRGLLQVTGRANYAAAGVGLGLPLEDLPELLEQPEHAAMSAAWWWAKHGLSELADAGRFQDIGSVINTGKPGRVPHGADERKALYDCALKVLA